MIGLGPIFAAGWWWLLLIPSGLVLGWLLVQAVPAIRDRQGNDDDL